MEHLNIVQWNSQSIIAHRHIFTHFLIENDIHIALLSETWLQSKHNFKVRGYQIARLDSGNSHNGVAILIHNSLQYTKIDTYFDDSIQNIAIRLFYGNNKQITIISFYSPGNCQPSFSKSKLNNLISSVPGPLFLAGDFNANNLAWGSTSTDIRGREVLEVIDDNNLVILNDGQATTVGTHVWRQNALDLTIVSPSLALNCNWSVFDDPLGSYHLPLITKLLVNNTQNNIDTTSSNVPTFFNFRKVDWLKYSELADNLLKDLVQDTDDPLKAYDIIKDTLNKCIELSLPPVSKSNKLNCNNSSQVSKHKGRVALPWWNDKCTDAVKNSKSAYNNFKSNPSEANYIEFKRLQALKKLVLKTERALSWASLCESFNRLTPITRIWNYMKRFNKTSNSSSRNSNALWVDDFLRKYTPDTVETDFQVDEYITASNSDFLIEPFSLDELISAIRSRRDSAFGLDGIPYRMLKQLNKQSLYEILKVFNLLWKYSLIPDDWKTDCVVPILKPNKSPNDPNSYRPIALNSCVGKVFEQLLKQRLEFFIESNNLLPSNQFGFRRGRSSRESIAHLQLDIFNSFKNNDILAGVFFDVEGAFNNVNHHILAKELTALGLPFKIIQWIINFLHGRKVHVKFNNNLFGPRMSYKGVCQGGILSPMIFILYIHKLNSILGTNVKNLQFADDLVIYTAGKNINEVQTKINSALKQLHRYFSYLNLDVNASKTKVVVFNNGKKIQFKFTYDKKILPISDNVKFLGILFSRNLRWVKYVDEIIARANKRFNIIKCLARTYWGSDPKILLMLYKSLVRSHFEYGFLCYGSDCKLNEKLDKIQNKNLRLITGAMRTTPINSLQVECNVPPIHLRFKYLKHKFLLKLFSIHNHPLVKKISSIISMHPYSAVTSCRCCSPSIPFLLHDFAFMEKFDKEHKMFKSINWPCYSGNYKSKFIDLKIDIDSQLKCKEDVHRKIAEDYTNHFNIYTDGSKNTAAVSMAFYVESTKTGYGMKLPETMSIFTAESLAILSALNFIKEHVEEQQHWNVISDSMSVLRALETKNLNANSNYVLHEIRNSYLEIIEQYPEHEISLMWTPAHKGVTGNEEADKLANIIANSGSGSGSTVGEFLVPSSDLVLRLKEKSLYDWKSDWMLTLNEKGKWYFKVNEVIGRSPWFTSSKLYSGRKFYTILNRLRFGHCRFNVHLHRMNIIPSPLCTDCNLNINQTLDHILFECPSHNIERLRFIDELLDIFKTPENIPRATQDLLRNKESYKCIYIFISNTIGDI